MNESHSDSKQHNELLQTGNVPQHKQKHQTQKLESEVSIQVYLNQTAALIEHNKTNPNIYFIRRN